MILITEQENLQELKSQANEFLKITNTKKDNQWTIQDTSLMFWHIKTLALGKKYIKKDNKLEYSTLKKFEAYQAPLIQKPVIYGTKIKRDIKKVLGYFYAIYLFLYKEIFKKDCREELPSII